MKKAPPGESLATDREGLNKPKRLAISYYNTLSGYMQAGKERIVKDLRKYAKHECYKSPYYLELCEKYPRFRHLLPDHPEPPVKLLPCPFCGGYGIPWFTCNAYYGTPGYFIRCIGCGAKTFPAGWGDGVIYPPEDAHEVTEQEALEKACKVWNCRKGA